MTIVLTAEQIQRLEACRTVFNRLTGSRFSLKKYIHFSVDQMLIEQEASAEAAAQFTGQVKSFLGEGGFNVH